MKAKRSLAGLTLLEVVVVIAVLLVAAMMILPSLATSSVGRRTGIPCLSNLRQLGLAYAMGAEDRGGRLPAAIPVSEGGWSDLLTNGNAGRYCWSNYVALSPYLNKAPRLLMCPQDIRKPAKNFVIKGSPQDRGNADFKKNASISYFVGIMPSMQFPDAILGGDRNLGPGSRPLDDFGFSPADDSGNDVVIQTNLTSAYCWSKKMHNSKTPKGVGTILRADASASLIRNFRDYQSKAGVPKLEQMTNSAGQLPPPGPDFRLVFP